jgi:Uma2 family endonuclease
MSAAARDLHLPPMTVEEFLAWPGDGSPHTHQLIEGEPVAMAPASDAHGTIQANLARLIGNHLEARRPGCRAVTEPGIVPRLRSRENVRVPDLAVTCAPPELGRHLVEDPVLVVEMLSPGNARETREAVWSYATLPSVHEILLVRSVGIGAELWRRAPDGSWPAEPALLGPGDALALASVGFEAPLAGLYRGTVHEAPRR